MCKLTQKILLFSIASLMIFPATGTASAVQWKEPSSAVQPTKVWKVRFTKQVNEQYVNPNTVYVLGAEGEKIGNLVSVSQDDAKVVLVEAPNGGYESEGNYTLHIDQSIASKLENEVMEHSVEMKFTIEPVDYKQLVLGTWNSSYNGYSIKATFKEDFTSDVVVLGLKNSGTYSLNGPEMTMTILGKTVAGKITKISDHEFTITSASGSVIKFNR